MARSRNIKPGFFSNDKLADIEPLGRLLFIGLWTICDYKGDLEYRPKRIKAQILPYDECDVDEIAINLDKSGFIRFYSVQGVAYLNIVNFTKHQNPHKNERISGSDIPPLSEGEVQPTDNKGVAINPDLSGLDQGDDGTDPADSLIPYPDSLIPIIDSPLCEFDIFWSEYPNKKAKEAARKAWKKIKVDKQFIINDIVDRNKWDEDWKKDGGKFIPHPATYLNNKRWEDEWKSNSSSKEIDDWINEGTEGDIIDVN